MCGDHTILVRGQVRPAVQERDAVLQFRRLGRVVFKHAVVNNSEQVVGFGSLRDLGSEGKVLANATLLTGALGSDGVVEVGKSHPIYAQGSLANRSLVLLPGSIIEKGNFEHVLEVVKVRRRLSTRHAQVTFDGADR